VRGTGETHRGSPIKGRGSQSKGHERNELCVASSYLRAGVSSGTKNSVVCGSRMQKRMKKYFDEVKCGHQTTHKNYKEVTKPKIKGVVQAASQEKEREQQQHQQREGIKGKNR